MSPDAPRHPSPRRKAVSVLLERANAHFHEILRRTDPNLFACGGDAAPEPVPLRDIVDAVNFVGQWPSRILQSSRLPRALTHVRQTTALMAVSLSSENPRAIAHQLGRFDRSAIVLGASAARKRLERGEQPSLDLFTAALVVLLRSYPTAHAHLDNGLRQCASDTLLRHANAQSSDARDV